MGPKRPAKGKGKKPDAAASQSSPRGAEAALVPGPSNATAATPSGLARGSRLATVVQPPENPLRHARLPPDDTMSEVMSSPLKPCRAKPKVAMCLRCSKRVYKDCEDMCCSRVNTMTRCTYCQEHRAKCLPIPPWAFCKFNHLMAAFEKYEGAIDPSFPRPNFSQTTTHRRANVLEALQLCYTKFVEAGKNLMCRRLLVGEDSKHQKVNTCLAMLEIASDIYSLHCTMRHANDIQMVLHVHNPTIAATEEYESSGSEGEEDPLVDDEDTEDWELVTVVASDAEEEVPEPGRIASMTTSFTPSQILLSSGKCMAITATISLSGPSGICSPQL
ncbi:hypothetical protein GMDG_02221 [Pseudogymnoascus destructans 20631-21]|uniref:Uncharacterized protein n=1 Tax=Pseudogymnoascus destructans (strain ATCC MYA-4855 / 20631-21) TaxID=658429 RepID=L8G267_PSED2|nr:hypothetical protein GMDG_02221 [Pseudogymnoascus destructans 20631-21]